MPIAICTTKANEQHYEVHSDTPNASAHFHPFFWGKGLNCSLYSLSWSPKSSNWTDMIRREEALQQHAMHCFVLIQLLFELWRLDIKCNRWIWPSPRNEVLKAVDCGLIQTTIFWTSFFLNSSLYLQLAKRAIWLTSSFACEMQWVVSNFINLIDVFIFIFVSSPLCYKLIW